MAKRFAPHAKSNLHYLGPKRYGNTSEVAEEFLHELLPDSDLLIDKCGHAAMMEHPDAFNKILYDWLRDRGF